MPETISVIIPCHNDLETITKTVESIQRQESVTTEIIIVDDGSDQQTQKVIQELTGEIQVLRQTQQGASAARNTGAKIANGTYLFFCDADVELATDALHTLQTLLANNPDNAFAYGSFDFDGRSMPAVRFSPFWLRRINYISTMSLLRREKFPGFDATLPRFQDWDLWLSVVANGGKGVATHKLLFRTLAHQRQGISQKVDLKSAAEAQVRKKHALPQPRTGTRMLWKVGFSIYRLLYPPT